ncbi:glycosyltransferase [Thiobacter aerophilum]|uniref:Glycosyltransferase n=1 Tax=Thiobacter aerophilum TaxID=3121275 RepID=A0ABV0EDE7_9BURK
MMEPERLHATVIVCTYNRAQSLAETLQCLRNQQVMAGRTWEVIVVDNNSRDDTRAVVARFQAQWPILRYVFHPTQGLSHARNRGIAEARGEILLFTDDDVHPEPDWLEQVLSGMAQHGADACGGFIAPMFEIAPPAWFTPRFYGFVAVRTERTDDYPITDPSQAPFGANMAFCRWVFDRVGLFDTRRGRTGQVLASGEDGEMFERILAAGLKVVFLGRARVHHKVETFRLTRRYLLRWRYQTSRNIAESRDVPGTRRLLNVPLYLLPQTLRAVGRAVAGSVFATPDEAVHRQIIVAHFLGTLHGLLRRRRS